jgi:hypothetical protein
VLRDTCKIDAGPVRVGTDLAMDIRVYLDGDGYRWPPEQSREKPGDGDAGDGFAQSQASLIEFYTLQV